MNVNGPMRRSSAVSKALAGEKWFHFALTELSGAQGEALWAKYDSHVNGRGGFRLAQHLLEKIDRVPTDLLSITWGRESLYMGDLGERFFGIPVYDVHAEPDPAKILNWWELSFERFMPENGGHVGRRIVFDNPNPAYDETLLVFGDSFSNGGVRPSQLSYWFKCLFKKYIFVWSSEFDPEIVDMYCPDVIVCETAERFLTRAPVA